MKIKKSDLAKIIAEELEAIRTAIPAWLGEQDEDEDEEKEKSIPAYNPDSRRRDLEKRNPGRRYSLEEEDYDQLPADDDPEEMARHKAYRDATSLPPEQIKRGTRVKDMRSPKMAREGTVESVMAGPGGGGAVVKFDDGKEEKVRMQFLQASEQVSEGGASGDIGAQVLAMRDDPEALEQFAAKMAQAFGVSEEEAMQKLQTAFGDFDSAVERDKFAPGGSAVGPEYMSEADIYHPPTTAEFKQLDPNTEMMPAIKQAEEWVKDNRREWDPDQEQMWVDHVNKLHSILFNSEQEGDLSPEEAERVHHSMQEGAVQTPEVGDIVNVTDGGLVGAIGKIVEPIKTSEGADGFVVRLTKDADKRVMGARGDEVIVRAEFLEVDQGMYGMQAMQEAANDLGWTPDELMGFLEKKVQAVAGSGPGTSGVSAKEMAYAFGGQWQSHQAAMEAMEGEGKLAKQGNKFILPAEESLAEIFGFGDDDEASLNPPEAAEKAKEAMGGMQEEQEIFSRLREKAMNKLKEYEDDDELADYYDEFPELRQKAADAGEAPADVASQIADEFGSEEEEDEEEVYERLRAKAMRALGEGPEVYQSAGDIPQELVDGVVSFLKDQRAAGVGELDLGSIMQDMGQEINTIKLILVDRLGYEIVDSETDPRGKVNFDQGATNEADEGGAGVHDIFNMPEPTGAESSGNPKEDALRQIVADSQAGQVDGTEVDLYSASAIVKVLDGLNPQNKEKYLALDPLSMAEMAMKMMKETKQKEATSTIRESVSRFMKVTLREEGRHK